MVFVDTENIALDDVFPRGLRDGVLDARLVVVFATSAYFRRPYCWKEWHLALSPWRAHLERRAEPEVLKAALGHVLVVLPDPASGERFALDRLPPALRQRNWPHAGDLEAVVELVEQRSPPSRLPSDRTWRSSASATRWPPSWAARSSCSPCSR